jgi:hypothetical protein
VMLKTGRAEEADWETDCAEETDHAEGTESDLACM